MPQVLSFLKTEEVIMGEALIAPSVDLIGDGSREKLAIKLAKLKEDGFLSAERKVIERYARKLMLALLEISSKKSGLGKEDLRSLECDELAILAEDTFRAIKHRAIFSMVYLGVIPIVGWAFLAYSLGNEYDGSAFVAYWDAYRKLRARGNQALGLAFKYMKEHDFSNWNIN